MISGTGRIGMMVVLSEPKPNFGHRNINTNCEDLMSDYRRLAAWNAAHQLVLSVYDLTSQFPKAEQFGLTSQIRRAAVSIAANIAEGASRTRKDFARFLTTSLGSTSELEYLLLLTLDLGYADTSDVISKTESVARMASGLRRTVLRAL